MFKGIIGLITVAACAGLAWYASADQFQQSEASAEDMTQKGNIDTPSPVGIKKPMKMDEPMEGGMMKKGMMKGDVKESAEKKDEEMEEMLEKEEESMPSMPARSFDNK